MEKGGRGRATWHEGIKSGPRSTGRRSARTAAWCRIGGAGVGVAGCGALCGRRRELPVETVAMLAMKRMTDVLP